MVRFSGIRVRLRPLVNMKKLHEFLRFISYLPNIDCYSHHDYSPVLTQLRLMALADRRHVAANVSFEFTEW